ncbi:MAG TPA: DUF5597 domain-containing protein [Bacteroidota bacterium]|nr:DUF5597 domain-containing protein [Bacteroidota bacterium]
MKTKHSCIYAITLCLLAVRLAAFIQPVSAQTNSTSGVPRLETRGAATQLVVDGKPFLILGGELNNSNASSVEYMKSVWPRLVKMHLNTVLIPVYWELMEPERGRFDFTLVDAMLSEARTHHMKIVFLWFGTWKNSMSCYVPEWMKKDTAQFPRAYSSDGTSQEIVSPFSPAALAADRTAFATLMNHIKAVDHSTHTVLMMQVENEIGMLPTARDHSAMADSAYASAAPKELLDYLRAHTNDLQPELVQAWKNAGMKSAGAWEEVFGRGVETEEFFMAWAFARYTNAVAEWGKKEYALPMYVNAALNKPGQKPGQYPSAGPLPHLFDIWKAGAPSIDMLSPDIYQKTFAAWITRFDIRANARLIPEIADSQSRANARSIPEVANSHTPANALFIPEVANSQSPANAFYAFGARNALGYSPYSPESLEHSGENELSQANSMLKELTPLILEGQRNGTIAGVLLDSAAQSSVITMGDYVFTIRHEYTWPYASRRDGDTPRYGGMILMIAPDEFYVAGTGLVVTFEVKNHPERRAGIARSDEGSFRKGKWAPVRRMNGDQTHQGRHINLPGADFSIQRVKLYSY